MGRLNLTIEDKLLERFREAANIEYSYKKGALKKGVEEAISLWLATVEPLHKKKNVPVETEGS